MCQTFGMPSHRRRCVNCIVPPHMLKKLLENKDAAIRQIALSTMLATTALRAERKVLATMGFMPMAAGGKRRTIYDCQQRRNLEDVEIVRGETDDEGDDEAVNLAFDGLGSTFDFFDEVFGRNSIDGRGMRLDGYVHYGRFYNNAFWNGRQMVFGDGDGRIFANFTKSLDVIGHELSHGVTEFSAGLEYHNQSGALNESMSDVFGSLVKQWTLKQTAEEADWLIGSEIFSPGVAGDALRSMKAPGQAYDDPDLGRDPQPAHMDNYQRLADTEEEDWGGVHINSGIPNHAFYHAAINIGGNAWEAPGHIWYESLRASSFNTEFQEFADRTYTTAGRLYGTGSSEQQAVLDAWEKVGIRVQEINLRPAAAKAAVKAAVDALTKDKDGNGLITMIKHLQTEVKGLRKDMDLVRSK